MVRALAQHRLQLQAADARQIHVDHQASRFVVGIEHQVVGRGGVAAHDKPCCVEQTSERARSAASSSISEQWPWHHKQRRRQIDASGHCSLLTKVKATAPMPMLRAIGGHNVRTLTHARIDRRTHCVARTPCPRGLRLPRPA
jgi:hypothetical protein